MKSSLVALLALLGVSVARAGDEARKSEAPAAPEESLAEDASDGIKALGSLLGVWEGTGTVTRAGETAAASLHFECHPAAGGHAIRCEGTTEDEQRGIGRFTDLFTYDAEADTYQWTQVGKGHPRVTLGGFSDETLIWRRVSASEGEVVAVEKQMVFDGDTIRIESVALRGNQQIYQRILDVHRTPPERRRVR